MPQSNDANPVLPSNTDQQPGQHTQDSVIDLLDSEISHLRSEYERPGWTKWALLGGLASVIWLILNEIEQSVFTTSSTTLVFLVLSLVYSSAVALRRIIDALQPLKSSEEVRFQLAHRLFGQKRAILFIDALHSLSIIILAYLFRNIVVWIFTAVVIGIHGLDVLAFLLGIIMSFGPPPFPDPIRLQKNRKLGMTLGVVELGANGIPAAGYLSAIILLGWGFLVADIRLAGLFLALIFLLRRLWGFEEEVPLLEAFVTIRRQLVLGKINVRDAVQQIDLALYGLQVSDVWQKDVQELLRLNSDVHSELYSATQKADAMHSVIDSLFKNEINNEQAKVMFNSLSQSLVAQLPKIKRKFKLLDMRTKFLAKMVSTVIGNSQGAENAFDELMVKVREVASSVEQQLTLLEARMASLKNSVDEATTDST